MGLEIGDQKTRRVSPHLRPLPVVSSIFWRGVFYVVDVVVVLFDGVRRDDTLGVDYHQFPTKQ